MSDHARVLRFIANGLVASAAHFSVLTILMEVVHLQSAGLANLLAAVVGVTVSFLGNRHFVFRATAVPWTGQALLFVGLYTLTSLMHGFIMLLWTDIGGRDYRLGFLVATAVQVVISYLGNRGLVFRQAEP